MVKIDSKRKGGVTELKCLAYLYELGYQVSTPFGENARYDIVLDLNDHLVRLQAKTAKDRGNGSFGFDCRMTRVNCNNVTNSQYDKASIDFFVTFFNNKCYMVPVDECASYKILRVIDSANNQEANVNLSKDYEAEIQIEKYLNNYKP